MREQTRKPEKRVQIPKLAVSKRFGKYKREEKKEERKADVLKVPILDHLRDLWYNCEYDDTIADLEEDVFKSQLKEKGISISASDIEKISVALVQFLGEDDFAAKAGVFLSALINMSDDEDFIVHVIHYPIERLGYLNRKKITINGDVDDELGYRMVSGVIIVNGEPGPDPGVDMTGGKIYHKGELIVDK